jgi:RNA polymerase sigma-70 factor (ECF subfamily)
VLEAVSTPDEADLVRRVLAGGAGAQTAFRQLYDRYVDEVLRFLRRLVDDHASAEDATQETFVRLHRGLKSYDPARPLRPWIFAVARNVAIDAVRARAKQRKLEALQAEQPAGRTPSDEASVTERRTLVHEALEALGPEHRAVVVLRHLHGMKVEEIAEVSDCTVRTAYNRLRAASVLLERELKRRGLVSKEVVS